MKQTRNLAWPILTFLVVLGLGWMFSVSAENKRSNEQQHLVSSIGASQAYAIQRQLDRSLSSTVALASVLRQNNGHINDFDSLAAEMLASYDGISNLQLAPNGIVRKIHPLKGNEQPIGHNLLNDPNRRTEALAAIESKKLTLAGPFELKQGGMAIIGRLPVFIPTETGQEQFWGFAIALIRLPDFLPDTDLARLEESGYDYELSRLLPDSHERSVFAQSAQTPLENPLTFDIAVPNGHWTLAVAPTGGWQASTAFSTNIISTILIAGLVAFLVYILLRQASVLSRKVGLRTQKLTSMNQRLEKEIFERKRVEEALRKSEQQLRTVISNVPVVLWATDCRGIITVFEGSSLDAAGYKPEDFLGKSVFDIYGDRPETVENMQRALAGEYFTTVGQSEEGLWFESWIAPLKDKTSAIIGAIGVSQDITEHKLAEIRLQELNEDLENQVIKRTSELSLTNDELIREIGERKRAEAALIDERVSLARRVEERTTELSTANAELARSARLKDEFLANMSHELRTPLNAVLGMSEALQEQILGPLNPDQLDLLNDIESSGRHLLSLINDILDLSKIEAGKLDLQMDEVNVETVSQTSLRLIKQVAHKKKLKVIANFDSSVTTLQADERHLKQVLVNLLSNAVKFTPEGGEIGLEVTADEVKDAIHFTVWDTGVGIAPENIEYLFQSFVQLDSGLARRHEGTGLGLALVYRLVELHGGSVTVESEVGQGSRFIVSLPWFNTSSELNNEAFFKNDEASFPLAQDKPAYPLNNGYQPLILLAEDNEANIKIFSKYLQQKGYQVVVARNGREAIKRAKEQQPALILMDIQMPGMDGLEATRQLRTYSQFTQTPIIALTALAMPDDRERCLAAGVNEYISKPICLKHLVQTIEAQISHW